MMFSLYRGLSYVGSGALGLCSVWGVCLCVCVFVSGCLMDRVLLPLGDWFSYIGGVSLCAAVG